MNTLNNKKEVVEKINKFSYQQIISTIQEKYPYRILTKGELRCITSNCESVQFRHCKSILPKELLIELNDSDINVDGVYIAKCSHSNGFLAYLNIPISYVYENGSIVNFELNDNYENTYSSLPYLSLLIYNELDFNILLDKAYDRTKNSYLDEIKRYENLLNDLTKDSTLYTDESVI